jgi:regulator of PEP synthase PpsR (kinase-PPPase family)
MKLEYERQKEKSTAEYYDLLNEQNENSKIVMHDIKRHLNAIKSIAKDKSVTEYIDDFIEDFSIINLLITATILWSIQSSTGTNPSVTSSERR